MNGVHRSLLWGALAASIVCWGCLAFAEQSETTEPANTDEILLKDVWASNMPGTRDVRELEPEVPKGLSNEELIRRSQVVSISRTLARMGAGSHKSKYMMPGFIVEGTGSEALKNSHCILVGKEKRKECLSGQISLVFYSGLSGRYVHLDKVSRKGNDITIDYHLVAHSSMEMTTHFALIPMELPVGGYRVTIKRGPVETADALASKRPLSSGQVRKTICESYDFFIE